MMTIQKRDWRVKKPLNSNSKFNMLETKNDLEPTGRTTKQRKQPKRFKEHTLPSQYIKE